ncbi:MAG TPA: response regulator, partial [Burkholderiaceae bacterium]
PARVLIVDDNQDGAELMAELLRMSGYEVAAAYDGVDGLAQAERWRPDVIVLDLGMPKLDGYGMCRALRASPWGQGMQVLALSGWGQPSDRLRTQQAGFDQHLVKPVDPDALIAAIAQALATKPGA